MRDRGTKKNAKGYKESWTGYEFHVDVNEAGFPLSVVLTSASLHDSQVAIAFMKLTSNKVQYCYDLMDAAYDAEQIWRSDGDGERICQGDDAPDVCCRLTFCRSLAQTRSVLVITG